LVAHFRALSACPSGEESRKRAGWKCCWGSGT
jgi:hypothetical protein